MATKIIILGKKPNEDKKKPIEFHKVLGTNSEILINKSYSSKDFKYIELISLNYSEYFDLIFAYDDPLDRSEGILFLGEWNDGIV